MTALVFGHDQVLARWAAGRILHIEGFGPCTAIGVAAENGDMLAVVVWHDWIGEAHTIQVSVAARTPKWASRPIIQQLLRYPFHQLGVNKVWSAIPHNNERSLRFNLGLGFRKEAVLRHHFGPGVHAVVTSMMANEYRKSRWFTPRDAVQSAAA